MVITTVNKTDQFILKVNHYLTKIFKGKYPTTLYFQPLYTKPDSPDTNTRTEFQAQDLKILHQKLQNFISTFYNTTVIILDTDYIEDLIASEEPGQIYDRNETAKIKNNCRHKQVDQETIKQYQLRPLITHKKYRIFKNKTADLFSLVFITDQNLYSDTPGSLTIVGQTYLHESLAICSFAKFLQPISTRNDLKNYHVTLLRVLSHEIGHLYALPHCPNPECGMQTSSSSAESLTQDLDFCDICYKFLTKSVCFELKNKQKFKKNRAEKLRAILVDSEFSDNSSSVLKRAIEKYSKICESS